MCTAGQLFDCACGDDYYNAVEEFQMNGKSNVLEFSSEQIAKVIKHQKSTDLRLCSRIVKLYDIVATCQRGEEVVDKYVKRVVQAIIQVHYQDLADPSDFFVSVIASAFTNYCKHYQDVLNDDYFAVLMKKPCFLPISRMTSFGCEAFLRSLLRFCQSGSQVKRILQDTKISDESAQELGRRLLFRVGGLDNWSMYSNFACYLSHLNDLNTRKLLKQALTLWSDPIIAKAYVYKEVLHYTKLTLLLFSHLPSSVAKLMQDEIIKFVGQGLPNHFSSTDYRSINLAKFFCEVLTESLKLYEDRTESIPGTLCQPEDEINQQLLKSVHDCQKAAHFYKMFKISSIKVTKSPEVLIEEPSKEALIKDEDDDDDDDDDLDPIESLEAPIKCNIAYIRDFIESFSEEKPYDERLASFAALPNVVKFQIKHEHPQLGLDLLNRLINWDNDFDCAEMEMHRKKSLCNALHSKMDGNVQLLCSMLPKESTRVPKQLLIIDVLSTAACEASLANLQILAKAAFTNMLDADLFQSREVPVRIPLILFFHRLLSTMPSQMIRSDMINGYLRALTCIKNVDKNTEQTISYSLHNLVDKLRDVQFSSDDEKSVDLSAGLAEMRSWMWKLQERPLSSI